MGDKGGGGNFDPREAFQAWEEYGQINQFSPWGNLIYTGTGDTRSGHLMVPEWQLGLMGQQAGLRMAALNRMNQIFGGSPMDLSQYTANYDEWWNQWLDERMQYIQEQHENQNRDDNQDRVNSSLLIGDGTGGGVSIPFNSSAYSSVADYSEYLGEDSPWYGMNLGNIMYAATPNLPQWASNKGMTQEDYLKWYWTRGTGSSDPRGVFSNYKEGLGQFFQHLDTPEMANWFRERFGGHANAEDRWKWYYWTRGQGKDEVFSDDYSWQNLLADYGIEMVGPMPEDEEGEDDSDYVPPWSNYEQPWQTVNAGDWESIFDSLGRADLPKYQWEIDWDRIPDIPGLEDFSGERQRMEDAMFRRARNLMDPVFQQRESALRESLANRGVPMGAEIADIEMGQYGRDYGNAMEQAALSAVMSGSQEQSRLFGLGLTGHQAALGDELQRIGLANQVRGAGINELLSLQGQEFNQLASTLGLSPVPSQNFNSFLNSGMGMNASAPFGMAMQGAQFGAEQSSDMWGGIMGMLGAFMSNPAIWQAILQ